MSGSEGLLYLSRADVEVLCGNLDPVSLVREALEAHARGLTELPAESYLAWRTPGEGCARSIAMPGAVLVPEPMGRTAGTEPLVGTKLINANPANVARGIPRASGLTALFDPESARVICLMDAGFLSALRTASVTVLSARLFAAETVESAGVIGAGELAAAHLELLSSSVSSLRLVRLFDLDEQRARALAERATPALDAAGIQLRIEADARSAIRGADLVVPVTTTTTGYIEPSWLAPGSVLVNVSLDDALPEVLLGADRLFVDDWELVRADDRRLLGRLARQGRVVGPRESAPVGARRVDGELGHVALGLCPGRCHPADVVVVNPFGLAVEDLVLAGRVHRLALERGIGVELPA